MLENPWIPADVRDRLSAKQAAFLACAGREAMYGGAAGGGKSVALLIAALQHVEEPDYHALLLRRTYKQLSKADSIMATSKEWLSGRAKWNGDAYKWTFPSGATLEFGHMENEASKYNYQGASYQYCGYDELTQFEEPMYRYLFSRQRRRQGSTIPIRMRSASNPGGVGHEWVKRRFVAPAARTGQQPLFIPARLDDNPNIDQAAYLESLAELDPITRAQLLAGDWNAVASGRFQRDWLGLRYRLVNGEIAFPGEVGRVPLRSCSLFLTCDPAATAEGVASADPDYTVISAWAFTPSGRLVWLDCHRFRAEIPDITQHVQAMYAQWQPLYVAIEAVASNRGVLQLARRTGMVVREVSPRGRDKLSRAIPAMTMAQSGRLWLPDRGHWIEDAIAELLMFTGGKQDGHDDVVDCLSYACALIEEFDGEPGGAVPIPLIARRW